MTSKNVLITTMIWIVVAHAMNCTWMVFLLSETSCNVINSTIRDLHLLTYIVHRMSYLVKETIAMKTSSAHNPLSRCIVHVSDPFGQCPSML